MYITEIDLGGHGECVECNLGPYRFEKPSKKQLKFMKIVTILSIGIPIQMDIVYFDDFYFRKKNLRMVLFGRAHLRVHICVLNNF